MMLGEDCAGRYDCADDCVIANPFDRNLGSGDLYIVREISGQALRAPQERKALPFRQRAGAATETA